MKRSREPEEDEERAVAAAASSSASSSLSPEHTASPPVAAAAATRIEVRAYKIAELDESAIDDDSSPVAMRCSLPPHRDVLAFKTYGDYEVHYSKAHTNRCVECGRNLPSEHLLGVHIEECHDAFAALRREKGEHTVSKTQQIVKSLTCYQQRQKKNEKKIRGRAYTANLSLSFSLS